jgi:hypothetical protein
MAYSLPCDPNMSEGIFERTYLNVDSSDCKDEEKFFPVKSEAISFLVIPTLLVILHVRHNAYIILLPSRLDINRRHVTCMLHLSAAVFPALCHVSLIDNNVWRICLLLVQRAPNGDQIVIETFCNKTKHLSVECTRGADKSLAL